MEERLKQSRGQNKVDALIWGVICSALLVSAIVVCSYVYRFSLSRTEGGFATAHELWGQFGDYIGGTLNPFLSFLALVLLVRTYRLQRDELAATRDEIVQSRAVAQSAVSSAHLQRFETTLFNLIELVRSMRSDLRLDDGSLPDRHLTGGSATRHMIANIVEALRPSDMYDSMAFNSEALFPVLMSTVSPYRLTQGAEALASAAAQSAGFVERTCVDDVSLQTYRPLALVALSVADLETMLIWAASKRDGSMFSLFEGHYLRRVPSHRLLPKLISDFMSYRMANAD